MKTIFNNICLFISSFVPLYILVVLKTIVEILNKNLPFNIVNIALLSFMGILISIGIASIVATLNIEEKLQTIKIIDYTNTTDEHFLGYFSLFVLFALTFDLSKISMVIIYFLILILIGIVYIKNSLFNINPFLNILGYSCYNVTFIDSSGNERTAQFYFKGKLNNTKYLAHIKPDGICLIVKQKV